MSEISLTSLFFSSSSFPDDGSQEEEEREKSLRVSFDTAVAKKSPQVKRGGVEGKMGGMGAATNGLLNRKEKKEKCFSAVSLAPLLLLLFGLLFRARRSCNGILFLSFDPDCQKKRFYSGLQLEHKFCL